MSGTGAQGETVKKGLSLQSRYMSGSSASSSASACESNLTSISSLKQAIFSCSNYSLTCHGRFIQALRAKALKDPGVEGVEASVSQLVKCEASGRVIGVRATRRGADEKEVILGDLVLVADGCFSSFRAEVLGEAYRKPLVRSYFVGAILNDARLPIDKHGTVALVKGSGPVLLYQIDEHDTRILVDVREPLPSDLKVRALEANSQKIYS